MHQHHFTPRIPNAIPAAPTISFEAFAERCHGLTVHLNGQTYLLRQRHTLDGIPIIQALAGQSTRKAVALSDHAHPHLLKGVAYRLKVNVQAYRPYHNPITAEENPLLTLEETPQQQWPELPIYREYPVRLASARHQVPLTQKPVGRLEVGDVIVEVGFDGVHDQNDRFWVITRLGFLPAQVPFMGYHRSFVVRDLHSFEQKTLTLKADDGDGLTTGNPERYLALVVDRDALDQSRLK